jgi:hypothetical protein
MLITEFLKDEDGKEKPIVISDETTAPQTSGSSSTEKPAKSRKPKSQPMPKSALNNDVLLDDIEKLFQKYLLPPEDIEEF